MFEYLFSQIVNGFVIGSIYALMAVGLTVIFSVLKIVNFSHGELYMLGGYFCFYLGTMFGLDPLLSVFGAIIITFLIGIAIEYLLISPVFTEQVERKDEYAILITFGLSIFFQNLALSLFGPWVKNPPAIINGITKLGGFTISKNRIIVSGIAIFLMILVLITITKTYFGKALRAVSEDRDAACSVGINPYMMNFLAFGIGAALAGGSGALIGPIFYVTAAMGTISALKCFVIVVLGGMGSIKGAIIASFILGMVESLGSVLFPDPTRGLAYKDAFGVLILAIVLLVRPTGLFGEKHVRLE